MSDHYSESLFFTKQLFAKAPQLLSMIGVDQCLLPTDFPQEDMDDCSSDDSQWQAVLYQLRQPNKTIPLSLQTRIMEDYHFATGRSVQFVGGIGEGGELSWHWQIRREEAVVDGFGVAFKHEQETGIVRQVIHPSKSSEQCQSLLDRIGNINILWESEGFQITSVFITTDSCRLTIRLNQSAFLFDILSSDTEHLLLNLQAAVVLHLISNQIGILLKTASPISVRADLQSASLETKIRLVYRLNQLGLTLSLSTQNILTKANPSAYRRCIYHIAQLCAINQEYEEETVAIVESQQDAVPIAFARLYQSTICKAK